MAVDLRPHVQPQIGRDLFVAAAAGVQLEADLASNLHQPLFDVVVHVLDRRIVGRGNPLSRDLIERCECQRQFGAVEHARLGQRGGVRLARRHLVRHQDAIERKRPLPLFEFRVQLLLNRPDHIFTSLPRSSDESAHASAPASPECG